MGLFNKKPPTDLGMYHIPVEIVLMNFHDIHEDIIAQFQLLADAHCASTGQNEDSVNRAVEDAMARWSDIEDRIQAMLRTDAGYIRDEAVKNGLSKYYDDYVSNRVGMFRFALGYRVMNAMTDYCTERGIEMSPE